MNNEILKFQDLDAWKEGHRLVLMIYKMTKNFPPDETFGLSTQMKRCVVSITSDIAEGFCRFSSREKIKFYFISLGSVAELQNQLIISKDVDLISSKQFEEVLSQTIKVHKIINGLIRSTKNNIS